MLTGEMRQLPDWLTAQVQSLVSPSPVELFRRLISTSLRPSSSEAVPENVIWPPGSTVIAGTANGGVISTGSWVGTPGGTAVDEISQARVAPGRGGRPGGGV